MRPAQAKPPPCPYTGRPGGWLLVTSIGLVLAFAAIAWVQMRQVALLNATVRDESDSVVWRFFQLESEFLQLRDQLREAQLEPEDMVRLPVAERVRQGGHNIPEATIRRRFSAGLELLRTVYQPLVDQWAVYDNAGDDPQPIDWSGKP